MKLNQKKKLRISKQEVLTIAQKRGFVTVKSNKSSGCFQIFHRIGERLTISQILSITGYSKW